MKSVYRIMGRGGEGVEVIDEFATRDEASRMLAEYQQAYRGAMALWIRPAVLITEEAPNE